MAPPLLFLKDIHLTFGGTPLLDGAELSIGPSERLVPGRPQRLGQIDPAQDRRGNDRAGCRHALRAAFGDHPLSAAEPGFVGLRHHSPPLSRPGSPRATIRTARAICWKASASPATKDPAHLSGGETPPRRARPRAGARARHSPARRAHQPSRRGRHRGLGGGAQGLALGHGADQPRPALPGDSFPGHRLARPRHHAAARQRLRRLRGLARCDPRGRGACRPQARPPHRAGGALAPLRRQRAPEAQPAPPRGPGGASRRTQATRWPTASRRREAHGAGGDERPARR